MSSYVAARKGVKPDLQDTPALHGIMLLKAREVMFQIKWNERMADWANAQRAIRGYTTWGSSSIDGLWGLNLKDDPGREPTLPPNTELLKLQERVQLYEVELKCLKTALHGFYHILRMFYKYDDYDSNYFDIILTDKDFGEEPYYIRIPERLTYDGFWGPRPPDAQVPG